MQFQERLLTNWFFNEGMCGGIAKDNGKIEQITNKVKLGNLYGDHVL